MFGIEEPVKEAPKAEKKAEKTEKKAEKKKEEKKYTLPADVVIPYADVIGGFSLEGKETATESEVLAELTARYPWIAKGSNISETSGRLYVKLPGYRAQAKGSISPKTLCFGSAEIDYEKPEDGAGADVGTDVLTAALLESAPELKGLQVQFLAGESSIVPIFKGTEFGKELKVPAGQTALPVIIPGALSTELDCSGKKSITPEEILAVVPSAFKGFTLVSGRDGDTVKAFLLPPYEATSSAVPKGTVFDISSGDVEVSLGFTKIPIKPSDFDGEGEVRPEQVCSFLVAQGYPEFAKERTAIEKVNKNLLVAILKSSSKGAGC